MASGRPDGCRRCQLSAIPTYPGPRGSRRSYRGSPRSCRTSRASPNPGRTPRPRRHCRRCRLGRTDRRLYRSEILRISRIGELVQVQYLDAGLSRQAPRMNPCCAHIIHRDRRRTRRLPVTNSSCLARPTDVGATGPDRFRIRHLSPSRSLSQDSTDQHCRAEYRKNGRHHSPEHVFGYAHQQSVA